VKGSFLGFRFRRHTASQQARGRRRTLEGAGLWRRSTEESTTTAKRKTLAAGMGPASRQLHELVPLFEGDVRLVGIALEHSLEVGEVGGRRLMSAR
jgi:hypothetical protein